ncbi:MAG: manganese efflux pump MntP family protein [Collinsella aerofaciens]
MGLAELVLLAVGLSMDAFAVSICKGLGMKKISLKVAVVLGLFFGGFQAGMPVIGWALGSQFMGIIGPIDHWIAFILLVFIGGKMLWEAFTEDEGDGKDAEKIDLGEYLILAIATSIDALAVGISFAALSVDIVPAVSLIGVTTFIFSVAGVAIGHTFGARYEKPATIVGGVVLILIGLKILLEHLGFWCCKTPLKLNVRMRSHAEFCMGLFMQTFACHTRMQKSAR